MAAVGGGRLLAAVLATSIVMPSASSAAHASSAAERFAIREIVASSAAPCAKGQVAGAGDLSDTCFELGDAPASADDVRSVSVIEVEPDSWGVNVSLKKKAEKSLSRFFNEHFGEKIALVAAGRVTQTPSIQQPDLSGHIQVANDLTKSEARSVAKQIQPGQRIRVRGLSAEDRELSALATRAQAVCESYLPQVGPRASVDFSSAQTAGQVVALARALNVDADGWEDFPADHFVAACSFDVEGALPEEGFIDCTSPDQPKTLVTRQLYVDENGRATEDFSPSTPPQRLCN